MTDEYLKSQGWYQWYNPNHWCHKKLAPEGYDETYWGVNKTEAIIWQKKWEKKDE